MSKRPRWPSTTDRVKRTDALHAFARWHGGRFLGDEYPGIHGKIEMICREGHRWWTSPAVIFGGHWCRTCAGTGSHKLAAMQEIARSRGGECLSTEYIPDPRKMRFRCAEGHEWEARPAPIRTGVWCPRCSGRTVTLADLQATAAQFGGSYLGRRAVSGNTLASWACDRGHRFRRLPRIVRQGHWCSECLEEARSVAAGRGGALLAWSLQEDSQSRRFRCQNDHVWHASPARVAEGEWCPDCPRKQRTGSRRAAGRKTLGRE
jgi:hypothetical protein